MVKLSIIIPVYNVESYIQATAVSLFEQHSPDIEYIFVNDCTPDRSWEVLAETLNKYPECRSASKLISLDKNGGVENARICGLQYAGGEYIWFIDSDDLIAEGAIKIILEALTEKAVDYLSINFQIIKDGEKIPAVNNGNIVETISPEELFSAVISYHGKHAAWRHIVKRFLTLQHPMLKTGLKIAEDYVMHSCWSIHAESAAIIKTPVYGYVTRQQSVMNSNSRLTILQSTREAIQTLKKFADTLPENKKNYFLEQLRFTAVKMRMLYFAEAFTYLDKSRLNDLLTLQIQEYNSSLKDMWKLPYGLRPILILDRLKWYRIMRYYALFAHKLLQYKK